jgi:N-methylhydantoinase B
MTATGRTVLSGRDLVEAEVFRKRLENLTTEMAITLGRTSGSIHVTESKDFSTALFDADGEQIGFSGWVSFHVASSLLGVEAVRAGHARDDIRPGDIFICNDPYTSGAMHQGDVGIVMPFFYENELLGWGFANEHVADVGGSAIGGMAPEARDVFSESLRLPGIRIGRDHRLDPSWRRFIEVSVRVPGPVLNDIQSMVAGNNVGQEKFAKLVGRYGIERFERLAALGKDLTEDALRDRIGKLPNGTYRAREWCEYDGHGEDLLLDLSCELVVADDTLEFRFSSETAQIDAFVNGAKPAVWGQCMTAVLCVLAYDIPVNAGLWRPITIDVGPEGTVVHPVPPAPVSNAHMEVGMRIAKLTVSVLSQACAGSSDETVRRRVAGNPHDGFPVALLFGPNQHGQPWVTVFQDPAVGVGGGAQTVGDGLDCYGAHCMLGCGMPDIEIQEIVDPKLFLYRKMNPVSSGAGTTRGGSGIEEAVILRGSAQIAGIMLSSVERVPPSGFGGGYPASGSSYVVLKNSGALETIEAGGYPELDPVGGETERPPSKTGGLVLNEGDVIILRGGGGGGLGDPLFRDPALVAEDVRCGYVTTEMAGALYGVVEQDGVVDDGATTARRSAIREQRIGQRPESEARIPEPGIASTGVNGDVSCTACGESLEGTERTRPITDAFETFGLEVRERPAELPPVLLREVFCRSCGSAVKVEVVLASS